MARPSGASQVNTPASPTFRSPDGARPRPQPWDGRSRGSRSTPCTSSPMQRARRTAELAGFDDPQVTSLLQEVDYGHYEGSPRSRSTNWTRDWEVYKDGCPDGESPAQIYARAQAFIQLVARHGDARVIASLTATSFAPSRWRGSTPTSGSPPVCSWTWPRSTSFATPTAVASSPYGTRREASYALRRRVQVRLRTPGRPAKTR